MVAQSTCPDESTDTAGCSPLAMISDSTCAPSFARDLAVCGCTVATTLAAELSTRSRSCGAGCGKATADFTTLSTNSLRAACFCKAALAGAAFFVGDFGAGAFACAMHETASASDKNEFWKNLFISSQELDAIQKRKSGERP